MEEGFGGKATNRYDKLAPLTSVDQHNNDVKVLLKQLTSLSHPMAFQASDGVSWEVVVVASSVLVDSSRACDLSRDSVVNLLDYVEEHLRSSRLLMCLSKHLPCLRSTMRLLHLLDFRLVAPMNNHRSGNMLYMEYIFQLD